MIQSSSLRMPISPEIAGHLASIIIEWSEIESGIDSDIATMQQSPFTNAAQERAEVSFSAKLDQWKRMGERLFDNLSPYRAAMTAIYEQAKLISVERNCLIHGVWCQPGPNDGGADFVIHWMRRSCPNPIRREVNRQPIDAAYLGGLHARISALNQNLAALVCNWDRHSRLGLSLELPAPR
ncbi:MAG: hypothetical protein ACXWVJ_01545 [Caulobacteraceae bacterium]